MSTRKRSKSLPAPELVAQLRNAAAHTDPVPNLPLPARRLTISKQRSEPTPNPPAWARTTDVTIRKDGSTGRGITGSGGEQKSAVVDRVLELARRGESQTYAALVSILSYRKRRREGHGNSFRQTAGALYQSRGSAATGNGQNPLLRLPEAVRRNIWAHVVLHGGTQTPKPVRLQPFNPHLRQLWLPEDFQNTKELLSGSAGALGACFAMRAEVLAYVLTTHRFHLLFSPYTTPSVCQELFHWMDAYGHLMQLITIELDLSKLGLGASPAAARLRPGTRNINTAVRHWVDIQTASRKGAIQSLTLLARRYHGVRPGDGSDGESPKMYCPADVDYAAASAITQLKGRINSLRIAGFNSSTTDSLIHSVFPDTDFRAADGIQNRCARAGASDAWPLLQGQPSQHRDMHFDGTARHEMPRQPCRTSDGPVARRQMAGMEEKLESIEAAKHSVQELLPSKAPQGTPRLPCKKSTSRLRSGGRELAASISAKGGAGADLVRSMLRKNDSTSVRTQECASSSETSIIHDTATAWTSSTTFGRVQEQSAGDDDAQEAPAGVDEGGQPDRDSDRHGRVSTESTHSWTSLGWRDLKARGCSVTPPVPDEDMTAAKQAGAPGLGETRKSISGFFSRRSMSTTQSSAKKPRVARRVDTSRVLSTLVGIYVRA